MSNLKTFLKVLRKVGYPNPDLLSVSRMSDYDLDNLLPDLVAEVGEEGADNFVEKALEKMSDGDKGIKVIVNDGEYGEYAYIKIYQSILDLDNDEGTVLCDWGWGESKILTSDENGNESYKTMQQISDDTDMGDWAEYDELLDYIKSICNQLVYQNCGFGIWWDRYV